ncbi:MAG: tetratricopeptide repeat protein [Treponema sp.]|nr:tetratricopeptide repeat protein [Treponema sp.]
MKVYIVCLLLFFGTILSAQDVTFTEGATRITRDMASPTENLEAMEAYNRGTELYRQNSFTEAEPYLLKAIELDSNYVDAMDHLGLVYRNLNRYDEAEYWYLRSIETNPDNIVPYLNLGVLYRFQGMLEDARLIYLRARDLDPQDPEPYFGIGMVYQMAGLYEVSIEFINLAMSIYYERESLLTFNAFYAQGLNYYFLDQYQEALGYFRAALIGHPQNTRIHELIMELEEILD